MQEGKWLKGIHVYLVVLDKYNIYMKQNMYKDTEDKYKWENHQNYVIHVHVMSTNEHKAQTYNNQV